jgi:CRP/FNR family transcriptional regulator, cyclic AMP receptor protein
MPSSIRGCSLRQSTASDKRATDRRPVKCLTCATRPARARDRWPAPDRPPAPDLTHGTAEPHRWEVEQDDIARSLRTSVLFERAQESSLADVARHLRRRRFRRGEVIFHQGDPGDALHLVSSGAVKIVLPSAEGDEAIIATLGSGDFFGELALLDGAPRSATAVAQEACETWTLARDLFHDLLERDPSLRASLLAGLARELRRLTGQVEDLHFRDLAGRLAMRLVRLARDAEPQAGEVHLDWPYTQSDLASMIGGTRQSVNKLLADLADRGLVVIERDRLSIPDVDALAREADR